MQSWIIARSAIVPTFLASSMIALAALGAGPAAVAEESACAEELMELWRAAQQVAIDDVTRGKIESPLENARLLCEEGEFSKAETRLLRARDLLASDVQG